MNSLVPSERVEKRIFLLRGHKVMLNTDLAEPYEVEPRVLVQAVKRNIERFPGDFMFQLTWEEVSILRSQSVILKEPASHSSNGSSCRCLSTVTGSPLSCTTSYDETPSSLLRLSPGFIGQRESRRRPTSQRKQEFAPDSGTRSCTLGAHRRQSWERATFPPSPNGFRPQEGSAPNVEGAESATSV